MLCKLVNAIYYFEEINPGYHSKRMSSMIANTLLVCADINPGEGKSQGHNLTNAHQFDTSPCIFMTPYDTKCSQTVYLLL